MQPPRLQINLHLSSSSCMVLKQIESSLRMENVYLTPRDTDAWVADTRMPLMSPTQISLTFKATSLGWSNTKRNPTKIIKLGLMVNQWWIIRANRWLKEDRGLSKQKLIVKSVTVSIVDLLCVTVMFDPKNAPSNALTRKLVTDLNLKNLDDVLVMCTDAHVA